MPKYLIAKIFVILIFLIIFYCGIAALRSGEIRSRGYKFNRDENPLGYWFSVLRIVFNLIFVITGRKWITQAVAH
jgi:hypothetical protein